MSGVSSTRVLRSLLVAAVALSVLAPVGGNGEANAQPIPVLLSPAGYTYERTPAYRWQPVAGAERYTLQVYRDTTRILSLNYAPSVCSDTECSAKPTTRLPYRGLTWRARAMVGGVWQDYSPNKSFEVLSTGFASTFASSKAGWRAVTGTWALADGNYFKGESTNASGWSSVLHSNNFPTLDYTVRMRRVGGPFHNNSIRIRGTAQPLDSYDNLASSYVFGYANSGSFGVWKAVGTTVTALVAWTPSNWIQPHSWNTLRVRAAGGSFQFYINGALVYSGSDTTAPLLSGQVGVSFYGDQDDVYGPDALLVDRAVLKTDLSEAMAVAGSFVDGVPLEGGDYTTAP